MASPQVTDRALRYRAQKNAPEGPRVCSYCGSVKTVEVEHIDGHEENTEPENLTWACRSCNTEKGIVMRNAGLGRRTRQFNPDVKGATTLGEWVQAVGAITPHKGKEYAGRRYGLVSDMPVSEAVAIIRATSPAKRSQFAQKLRRGRKNSGEVKKAGRGALKGYDRVTGAVGSAVRAVATLPRKWAGALVGERNPGPSDRAEMTFDQGAGDYIVFGVAVPGGSQHFAEVGDAERAMREYRSSAPAMGNPDESVQDKSWREWAENYQRVQAAPERATEKDLRRALGFLDHKRRAVIRRYQEQGRPVDPNVIAGYDNDYDYLRSLMLKRNPRRRNSTSGAAAMYESFHGKAPEGETIVREDLHRHTELAPLGVLVDFHVATITGLDAHLATSEPEGEESSYDETAARPGTVFLCANEDGTQLYFRGGDQSLDLDRLKFKGDWVKDDMVIGVIYEVTYRTRKKFDKFKLTDYYHELGEETGDQPFLRYERLSPHLYISGGKYKIKMPLIGMSAGIEN